MNEAALNVNLEQVLDQCKALLRGPVAVLCGGESAEREISLQSGAAVLLALCEAGIDTFSIDADGHTAQQLLREQVPHAFVALHGAGGEDGVIQGLLQTLNISYTGSGVLASALAMDKLRSKLVWRALNIASPQFRSLQEDSAWQTVVNELGGRVFVKPNNGGSSLGMSIADSAEELQNAFQLARRFDRDVLAEQLIDGPEFTVAIVADTILPTIRLATGHDFYDFDAKYVGSATQYFIPCGLSASQDNALRNLAWQAYTSLGCCGWGRVDAMQDAAGNFFILEVNTIPGMTDHSLVPKAAAAQGVNFVTLVLHILRTSLQQEQRHA